MEDVFDAAWREHPASHDTQVDTDLASLIDIRGLALLDDPKLLRQLLLQKSPDAQRHVGALLAALTADVPKRLVAAKDDEKLPELLRGSARHLQEDAGLDADWAQWAVQTWAHAFALPTAGLGSSGAATAAPSFASSIASARPIRADGFDPVGAGTIGGLWDRSPVQATDPQPAAGEAREPTLRDNAVFAPIRSETGFGTGAATPLVATPPGDEVPPHAEPHAEPLFVEPLFPERSTEPAAVHVQAPDEPVVAPTWVHHERPVELRGRSMTGPIVMVVVVLVAAAVAWFALEGTPWSKGTTRMASTPDVVSPKSTTTEAPASTTAPAASNTASPGATDATPPRTASTPATTGAADGAASPTPPVEGAARPVESPPVANPPVATAPVEPESANPAAHRRPAIARIDVPTIVEGAPFAVGLQLATSARDVTSIERRVVDSDGAWPKLPTQLQASGLQRAGERTLLIPFRAMDAPSRAVVEFVAIGRDGVRSEAKRVAIALHQPDPAIAALEIPAACTSATCGVVIESREIEPEVGTRGAIYQLSVRMDDRQVVTSTAPYRLQIGSRARLAGTRLVPADRQVP